jgi:hypothetical protein
LENNLSVLIMGALKPAPLHVAACRMGHLRSNEERHYGIPGQICPGGPASAVYYLKTVLSYESQG